MTAPQKRIAVGIAGATGIVYGVRLLQALRDLKIETHLTYHATKVVHNCLLADRFPPAERPVAADLAHGWPDHIRERVRQNWTAYGFKCLSK